MTTIKIKKLVQHSTIPEYNREGDAGLDIRSIESGVIPVGQVRLIKTGLAIELPAGHEAQIRPRSGLALKHGVTVLNAPGTIDTNYRGEICVILINLGQEPFKYSEGDRIAQMIISKFETVSFEVVEDLTDTVRGSKGFGSSGRV